MIIGGENPISCPEGWYKCECTCTCIPPNEGDDPKNPTSAVCNGKNDCCSTYHGIFSDNPHCADYNKPNYTAKGTLEYSLFPLEVMKHIQ